MSGFSASDLTTWAQLLQPRLKAILITGFAPRDFDEMWSKSIVVMPKLFQGRRFQDALAGLAATNSLGARW